VLGNANDVVANVENNKMNKWGASNNIDYVSSGKYFTALIGPYKGKAGEAVKYWDWGGLSLKFSDSEIITFANSDVSLVDITNDN